MALGPLGLSPLPLGHAELGPDGGHGPPGGTGGGGSSSGGSRGGSSSGGSRGGNSGRSSGNRASPGRSTPGSPNASDGKRGSSMGADGGSARGSNNSSSSASPSRSTPGSPNAPDGRRGASMGPSGGSARGGGSSGAGESIRGSRLARSSFSFNSDDAGEMGSFRSSRQMARGLEGANSFGGGTSRGGVASGAVAGSDGSVAGSSLDTTTKGYQSIVGDGLTEREAEREAQMQAAMQVDPSTRDKAFDRGMGVVEGNQPRGPRGVGLLGVGLATAENALAGYKTASELDGLESDMNLPGGFFNDEGAAYAQGYASSRIDNSPLGALGLGDEKGPQNAMLGAYDVNDVSYDGPGKNSGGADNSVIKPELQPRQTQTPQQPSNGFGYGQMTNYGSYKRRLFQNL